MSVYIKGRKPPNSCDDCWVSDCPNDEHIDGYRMMGRPTYCPLIHVPDHGRLIDGDVAEAICFTDEDSYEKDFFDGILFAADFISKQTTVIPADEEAGE